MKNTVFSSPRGRLGCVPILIALFSVLFTAPPLTVGAQEAAGPYLAAEHAARRGDISESARLYARVLALDPDNFRLMEQTMLHQLAAGQIAQAIVVARKLEQAQPGHHLGVLIVAANQMKEEKYSALAERLASGEGDSASFIRPIVKAWATHHEKGPDAARAGLRVLEANKAGGPFGGALAAYHLGLMEAADGNDVAAAAAFTRAADVLNNGGPNRLIRARAGALARSGNSESATALIRARLDRTFGDWRLEALANTIDRGEAPTPEVTAPREGVADALYFIARFIGEGNGRLIGLAYARLAAYLDPDLTEAQLFAGDLLAESGQFGLAIEAYARIPEDAPEALAAQIGRAEALRDADELEEALGVMREAALRHTEEVEPHIALGDMLRRAERFAEAAIAYDSAITMIGQPERRHWALFYQRGIAHERAKQWPKAEADFLQALELEKDQPLVLNYLGYSWVEMRVNLEEAQAMIERAVEQRMDDGFITDSLGWVLYRLGKYQEALAPMARAVEIEPVDPTINDHYGDVLWVNGRRNEAKFQWKRALSFNPTEEGQAARIKRKLKFGLDQVLKEEAEAGPPALAETEPAEGDGG